MGRKQSEIKRSGKPNSSIGRCKINFAWSGFLSFPLFSSLNFLLLKFFYIIGKRIESAKGQIQNEVECTRAEDSGTKTPIKRSMQLDFLYRFLAISFSVMFSRFIFAIATTLAYIHYCICRLQCKRPIKNSQMEAHWRFLESGLARRNIFNYYNRTFFQVITLQAILLARMKVCRKLVGEQK